MLASRATYRLTRYVQHLKPQLAPIPPPTSIRHSLASSTCLSQCTPSLSASTMSSSSSTELTYLSAADAADIDKHLMSDEYGFTLDQLMELAGLSCAAAVYRCYPPDAYPTVLVVVGPGNNGGDGLVAARHLHHFGYRSIHILLAKQPTHDTYTRLVTQNRQLNATFHTQPPATPSDFSVILDAVFGFSFNPADGIRPPYDRVIEWMSAAADTVKLAAIDIPSGWHVEQGDVRGTGLKPHLLVSLTAPKLCAQHFVGDWHVVGGRFVPHAIAEKYKLKLPKYNGSEQFAVIKAPQGK